MLNPIDTWNPMFKNLSNRAKSYHSQYDEDGLVEAIFEICEPKNRWCVEAGAADGITISNTAHFIEEGWNGILVEKAYETLKDGLLFSGYRKILENYKGKENVFPVHETISENNLDEILHKFSLPRDFDFLSLDIDSYDLETWQNLRDFVPNLVCIECNDEDRSMGSVFYELGNPHNAASIAYLKIIAEKKGYDFVCATRCNAIFLKREFLIPLLNN